MIDKGALYRSIPKVDILLEKPEIIEASEKYGHGIVMDAIREQTDVLRKRIGELADGSAEEKSTGKGAEAAAGAAGKAEEALKAAIENLVPDICARVKALHTPKVRKVINGTGTILHTNLGRAPISRSQAEKLIDIVTGYSNLEYDLEKGARGERYSHFEALLCRLTGAEAAMVVNNNAAAVMLILNTIAKGGEVVVSRGELVEIGGKFRVPDVMEQSGAALVEVGTTNKTHLADYEDAVTEETKAFLKVHTSNYRIVGFTESVPIADLRPLAEKHGIPVIEDLGSGVLVDLSKYGITYEPTVQDSIRAGADVVCFSGDKLLGGPQAGIIIGKKKYIQQMKKNQLTRALRVDKFTVTALELVLLEYLREENAKENIPVLRMIAESAESTEKRAGKLADLLRKACAGIEISTEVCESQIGGGSLPLERIKSTAVVIKPKEGSAAKLERKMLQMPVPIVGRTSEDAIHLDVRTLNDEDFVQIAEMFGSVLSDGLRQDS